MYAVMKAYPISCIKIAGCKATVEDGQPTRIIPVFDSYDQAIAWHGSSENIAKLDIVKD